MAASVRRIEQHRLSAFGFPSESDRRLSGNRRFSHPQGRGMGMIHGTTTDDSFNGSVISPEPDILRRQQLPSPSPSPSPQPQPQLQITSVTNGDNNHKRSKPRLSMSRLDPVLEGDHRLLRGIKIPPPGDVTRMRKRGSRQEVAKQRSLFLEDAFASRGQDQMAENIRNSSMVVVEVRTNVIVNDEFAFIMQLANLLSARYNRPAEFITVTVQHSLCLLFGGTFDPAYTLTVRAIPSYVQPATNKRNVALIQKHMEKTLHVSAARGVVHFIAIPEDCSGFDGRTLAGDIADVVGETREEPKPRRRRAEKETPGSNPKSLARNDNSAMAIKNKNKKEADPSPRPAPVEQAPKRKPSIRKSFISNLFLRTPRKSQESSQVEG